MQDILETSCCGVNDFTGFYEFKTPKETLSWIYRNIGEAPILLLTDRAGGERKSRGEKFVDYLRKHKLGIVSASPVVRNKNSGNRIRAWLWAIDNKNLERWADKFIVPEPDEVEL